MEKLNLAQKLIEVRKAVPCLENDGINQHFGFKYTSSTQILAALRGAMDEQGVLLVPSITRVEVRDHATSGGKHEFFTMLDMVFTWVNAENPADAIACPWHGQGLDSSERGAGKAMTYAEKYFLKKFFNVPTDEDDPDVGGKTTAKRKATPRKKQAPDLKPDPVNKPVQGGEHHSPASCSEMTDEEIITDIRELLLAHTGGDLDEASKTLEEMTAFEGKKGERVPGVDSTSAMVGWSRVRLEVNWRKARKILMAAFA